MHVHTCADSRAGDSNSNLGNLGAKLLQSWIAAVGIATVAYVHGRWRNSTEDVEYRDIPTVVLPLTARITRLDAMLYGLWCVCHLS